MFERNIVVELEKWVAKSNHKPLILRGSRQVGKTTLVDNFSRNFDNYLYLNFEKNPSAITLFEKEQEIDDLLAEIFLFCNKENKSGKTLLFMDEAPHDIAVRVWSQPFSTDEVTTQNGKKFNLINLPFYYVGILEKILGKNTKYETNHFS